MPTATYRKVDPAVLVKMQETPDPDTGAFPSLATIVKMLADQDPPVQVTRSAVQQATKSYRTENGLPPAPRPGARMLPWELPKAFHHDYYGERLHYLARLKRTGDLPVPERQRLNSMLDQFKRMGPATVIAFDKSAAGGVGGWVIRQRVPDEELWYGVMAVRP